MAGGRVHFISIGGAAMHNIALEMHSIGYEVTGSDDEIYEPSLSRLKAAGIAPEQMGWYPEKLHAKPDFVILGMHARADNPELEEAQRLGIPVYSYPEFIYNHAKDKIRVVVAGSHGKTTTTAMIIHALRKNGMQSDYLVGAQLEGFDRMVKLSDAPVMVIEGDEYLSSPVHRIPKIHYYKPQLAVITGIAWDHINVFPTFENYCEQFEIFSNQMSAEDTLIYFEKDGVLRDLVSKNKVTRQLSYAGLSVNAQKEVVYMDATYPISVIGHHNLCNMEAAMLACLQLGIDPHSFLISMADFKGAAKRLQKIGGDSNRSIYLDFAHAPSKVRTTVSAFRDWFSPVPVLAVLELHTFSSLNKAFLPEYREALASADRAIVYYNQHTLEMKKMPPLDPGFVKEAFGRPDLEVITDTEVLKKSILSPQYSKFNVLLMSSGNFSGMNL